MKNPLHLRILALLLVLGSPAFGQSTWVWYVDASATPPGIGTQDEPFTSLAYAVEQPAVGWGHTIVVAPGVYDPFSFKPGLNIRSTEGPLRTRITGANFRLELGEYSTLEGFWVEGQVDLFSYVVLRNCVVLPCPAGGTCANQSSWGVRVDNGASVESCTVAGFDTGIAYYVFNDGPETILNTIVVNCTNWAGSGAQLDFSHCVLPPGGGQPSSFITLSNTLVGDPEVWDVPGRDFQLRPGSPCIGTGFGTGPGGSAADIGALVYDPTYASPPTVYCAGAMAGASCTTRISASGSCSATVASPFVVSVQGVPSNLFGLLVYSLGQASIPFGGATLCLAPPLVRTAAMSSGSAPPFGACSGTLELDFNARIQSGVDPSLVPGTLVHVQGWYRDPSSTNGFGMGLSDALRFGIAP